MDDLHFVAQIESFILSKLNIERVSVSRTLEDLIENYGDMFGHGKILDFIAEECGITSTIVKSTSAGFKFKNFFYCYKTEKTYPTEKPCTKSMSFAKMNLEKTESNQGAFSTEYCQFLLESSSITTEAFTDGGNALLKIGDIVSTIIPMSNLKTYIPEKSVSTYRNGLISELVEKEISAVRQIKSDGLIIISGPTVKKVIRDSGKVKVLSALNMPKVLQELNFMQNHDEILVNLRFISIKAFLPKLCNHCKAPIKQGSFSALHVAFSISSGDYFSRGPGCDHCYDGYEGIQTLDEIIDRDNIQDFLAAASDFLDEREASKKNNIFHIYSCLQNRGLGSIYKNAAHCIREGFLSPKDVIDLFF